MPSNELENLARAGLIHREPPIQAELDGLLRTGTARLADAANRSLTLESRFDLAYNAAPALSLAALRHAGYRSGNRYQVFQCLPHTLGVAVVVWRLLAKCHQMRNQGEYEGFLDVDDRLVEDLVDAANTVRARLLALARPT